MGQTRAKKQLAFAAEVKCREKAWPRLTALKNVNKWNTMEVNGLPFRVPALGFFQVNSEQAGKLVDLVYRAAGTFARPFLAVLLRSRSLIGLYCDRPLCITPHPARQHT